MQILTSQAEARATRHVEGVMFQCAHCLDVKPVQTSGGTGYGYDKENRLTCYDCCGAMEKAAMIETGRATLYLTDKGVTDWPGVLTFKPFYRKTGRHNMAGKRYDVWFTGPDGKNWHGVTYGDNTQICHCKRTRA